MCFPKQALFFTCLQYKSFENTVGYIYIFFILNALKNVVCNLFQLGDQSKILSPGKWLNLIQVVICAMGRASFDQQDT